MKQIVGLLLCSMVVSVSLGQDAIISRASVEKRARIIGEVPPDPEKNEALAFARKFGIPAREIDHQGRITEILRIEDNRHPLFLTTHNIIASKTVSTDKVWDGSMKGLNLRGKNMLVGLWDGGKIRTTHVEFGSRVYTFDSGFEIVGHATHVAGTIGAAGLVPEATGMANQCFIEGYDWENDDTEMRIAAGDGLLISNHSYGLIHGFHYNSNQNRWEWHGDITISEVEDYKFGFYGSDARQWDDIAFENPYYLIVRSAGNDRLEGPGAGGTHYVWDNGWQSSNKVRNKDGGPDGYDCIGSGATSKNILTVGAVHDLENGYETPEGVSITSFSTFGPTDDGRIKPDLVGNGSGLYSSYYSSDSDYRSLDGTSMSAPNVSGSLVLLQELHQKIFSVFMKSATLKALVLHTADDAGNPGPDYKFGWGLLNTYHASELIIGEEVHLIEDSLVNQENRKFGFYAPGDSAIKVTICWTDPAGPVIPHSLNPEDLALINDLDIRLLRRSDSLIFMPYVLSPEDPGAPARTGDNTRDNVEQIYLPVSGQGYYDLEVSHKGTITGVFQRFSLVIEGMDRVFVAQDSTYLDNNNGFLQVTSAPEYPPGKRFVWLIEPVNQQPVTLRFDQFHTDTGDMVTIYDGPGATYPLLGSFSGSLSNADTVISSTTGALFIEFHTGNMAGFPGFSSSYCTVAPEEEVVIMGPESPCEHSDGFYHFDNLPESGYQWGFSDNITDSVSVEEYMVRVKIPGDAFMLSVTPENLCGSGQTSRRTIVPLTHPPSIHPDMTGDTEPCTNSVNLYSVEDDSTARYRWMLPEGWLGKSDSASIWITPDKVPGTITVIPFNSCGDAESTDLAIQPISLPRAPVIESEKISPCQNTVHEFYILSEQGVDYRWSVENDWEILGADSLRSVFVRIGSGDAVRIYLSSSNKCGDTLTSRNFLLSPSPEPPELLVQPSYIEGYDEILIRNFSDYAQVNWFRNDSLYHGFHGESLILVRNGIYSVDAINPEGCIASTDSSYRIEVNDESLLFRISTGSGGYIRIGNDTGLPATVRAYDLAGRMIHSDEIQPGTHQFHTPRRGLVIIRIAGSQQVKTALVFIH